MQTLPEFTARFSTELGGGPQCHLIPSICEEVCIVRDTKQGILGVTQHTHNSGFCRLIPLFVFLCYLPHTSGQRAEVRTSLSGSDSVRQGFPLESQFMTSTVLSSHPQLHLPVHGKLKKGFRVCQVKWMFELFEYGRRVLKIEIRR